MFPKSLLRQEGKFEKESFTQTSQTLLQLVQSDEINKELPKKDGR